MWFGFQFTFGVVLAIVVLWVAVVTAIAGWAITKRVVNFLWGKFSAFVDSGLTFQRMIIPVSVALAVFVLLAAFVRTR